MKSFRCGLVTLAAIVVITAAPELGTRHLYAADLCIQLAPGELAISRRRAGQANDCRGDWAAQNARNISRDNATNALDQICTNSVTRAMAAQACNRVGMVVNTSWFFIIPPLASIPAVPKVKYIGHGIGDASGINLCVMTRDLDVTVTSQIDGTCTFPGPGYGTRRFFATARARARCAVVCSDQ
jgi:hypothetical protein